MRAKEASVGILGARPATIVVKALANSLPPRLVKCGLAWTPGTWDGKAMLVLGASFGRGTIGQKFPVSLSFRTIHNPLPKTLLF